MDEQKSQLVLRIEALNKKKAAYETEKALLDKQLSDLDTQIKSKGYDPEKLADQINTLTTEISTFEAKATPIVEAIEKSLSGVDNKEHIVQEFPGFENH